MADVKPLVIDADGAFLKTDLYAEHLWAALARAPLATLRAVRRGWRDPAARAEIVALATLDPGHLPVHPDMLDLARASRAGGRDVILASTAPRAAVEALARHHGLSAAVIAGEASGAFSEADKRAAVLAAYPARGFDYAGGAASDRPLWEAAENAYIVGRKPGIEKRLIGEGHSVSRFAGGWRMRDLVRALRPHQWVKNVLLLVPMIAAHAFDLATLALVLLGMAAFSAAASSIYIVNDLLDLEADRQHATKRRRPFASGAVPIRVGTAACGALMALALVLAIGLGWGFVAAIVVYMALSLAYSLRLKRLRWVDIAVLATLYSLRVVAGAAAADVPATGYLLVFIFPVFLTLGCVKRITEVTRAATHEKLPGRGYAKGDRNDLLNVAALGGVGALFSFFMYSLSHQAQALYPDRWLLWVAMVPLAFWLLRMVRYGYFGKQDYDPIVFALRDPRGIGLICLMLALMFYAAGLWRPLLGL